MINVVIPVEDVDELTKLHNTHPHHVIRRRALILLLKHQQIPHHKIAFITCVCANTVRKAFESYQLGGIDLLMTLNYRKPESKLKPFDERIKEYFEKKPVTTIAQACHELEKLTHLKLKPTQMRAYLKNLGIKWIKVNAVPAKVDLNAQQQFHDEKLLPRLAEAEKSTRAVYFVDAAHFVLGAFLGYLWSLTRIFVRTPSGRQRFNVLGALHAITKELTMITNDSYITSIQVCDLLRKLAQNTTLPITVILDNARYQRCRLVIELAEKLGIELLFLPPYSPNLNLIERLWKITKKECLNSRYYDNFNQFSGSIKQFFLTMNRTHQKQLNSLLTLKFQLFNEAQINKVV